MGKAWPVTPAGEAMAWANFSPMRALTGSISATEGRLGAGARLSGDAGLELVPEILHRAAQRLDGT
ncbi:MAG TPA: hypothetical protein DCG67_17240, partial [Pseudomonas sp.]|nr:hypothetical protein [Pseudomonas sp.]